MANPYRLLFKKPGTVAFTLAGLVARMPISMVGIGIITMVAQLRDSYWLAGALAATFTLTMAFAAPQISRAVDRLGQSTVLPYVTVVSVLAMWLLLLSVRMGVPDWILFVLASLAGLMPSMPAMVRARWTEILRDTPDLHTAYSLESVLDEVCFILGPPLAVGLSVIVAPEAGPLVASLLLAVGVTAFVMQKKTEPKVTPEPIDDSPPLLTSFAFITLILVLIALGTIVGSIDVISVAFAEQQGQQVAASFVLSVYAIGSCLAGLAFGAMKPQRTLNHQLAIAATATALTTLPLMYVSNLWMLAGVLFLSGIFFAPTMIIVMGIVEKMVPQTKLTEGLTWMITGLSIGVATGAALGGWFIDQHGISSGFLLAVFSGILVFLLAILYQFTGRNRAVATVSQKF
ncbi:MFS transporter [Photobacterium ganghwense]|uniref:MFS transporter n=1 Tax=Photobacterium ganghwense TaxID=320778 RepID=A0A0J1K7M6_9GAMM|nr:MFS transporter [Photobacterium ganghwense]KLV10342.1 MFS transporter [Photobacterium ganghwense]PSU09765.1 MFS transporter [Photobacterium ganghwense]QSV17013.1 MFS transporter [Photobacterium ganghwense]